MRECTQKLKDDHPVKKWFNWVGSPPRYSSEEQKKMLFLSEILNSKFNLITDVSVKNSIIEALSSVSGHTLAEELLRSYLYLMIGNVTRSDNLLREFMRRAPYHNWQGHRRQTSIYHQVASSNLEQILKKLSRHPSDRKSFELFNLYIRHFYNETTMVELLKSNVPDVLDGKWGLYAVTSIAPDFVHYLKINRQEETKRQSYIKQGKFPPNFLVYWVWGFFDVSELVNESFLAPLVTTAETDKLWFYYLMDNERLADLYISKKGRADITSARSNLRGLLKEKDLFMLSLFKLIELGDIDSTLVAETLKFLMNE